MAQKKNDAGETSNGWEQGGQKKEYHDGARCGEKKKRIGLERLKSGACGSDGGEKKA